VWELIFMLVILKIPVVYLCCVVYWAIKAEPLPEEPAALTPTVDPEPERPDCPWGRRRIRPRPPRPLRRSRVRRVHASSPP
jgi:hypothetical protein